jgi:addiction module HigA family antidote
MKQHNPPHPGVVLKELYLAPLEISVTAAARALGVARKNLSLIVNGRLGISPEMALRISLAFNTSPESWLDMQRDYDLWQLRERAKRLKVERLAA